MDDSLFAKPVTVRLTAGGEIQRVRSSHDASALLASTDWPRERTSIHRDAFETAEKVPEGYRSADDARSRFVVAAQEAGILVEGYDDDNPTKNRVYFESSVRIQPHGSSTVRQVKSVNGACEMLIDWPQAKRGPYYQSARETVEGAIEGTSTPSQAREAFVALAEHAGILVEGREPSG
ncbi:DUF982 domain-containing protein [Mesorhizobium sp. AR07]|uniref:DUF982 domain-containing protein n=1 Tax=Mesorhizobium sp. AR07 TaxID=2865838 RepID=UPI002160214A|nr:DUF982 domain-containing protein [Mesorhizobium sp. AR07]UVK46733.1 DUF982 domain-containing protein [Mesorhizobium sp. AR07]